MCLYFNTCHIVGEPASLFDPVHSHGGGVRFVLLKGQRFPTHAHTQTRMSVYTHNRIIIIIIKLFYIVYRDGAVFSV